MPERWKQKPGLPYLLLILSWLVAIVFVNPFGEFPLNDDTLYANTVYQLLEDGHYLIDPWVGVSLFTHVLWGTIFTGIFGYSLSVLRISTLVMSLAGTLVGYKVFNDLFKDKGEALLLALFIAFNPIYFNLSFTYMTDITFYGMVVLSGYFYIRSYRASDRHSLYFATFFAILAALTRQIGLFMPVAALFTTLVLEKRIISKKVLTCFLHTMAVVAALVVYTQWIKMAGQKGEGFRDMGQVFEAGGYIKVILLRWVDHSGRGLAESGLWFLPLAAYYAYRSRARLRRYILPAGIVTTLLGITVVLQTSHFPGGNVFYITGLGPRTLADVYIFGLYDHSLSQQVVRVALKALALTGGILITWLMAANTFDVFNRIRKKPDFLTKIKLFSLLGIILYQMVFLGSFTYFDRYGIILFIPMLILISPMEGDIEKKAGFERPVKIIYLCLIILFSLFATRDYLSWNKARWQAAERLEDSGIAPQLIDGGLEYIMWHGKQFESYGQWDPGEYEYVLSYHPMAGYDIVDKEAYNRLIPCSRGHIYALRKKKAP